MVHVEVGIITMATYLNSYSNSNSSQQVDIRDKYFRPLHKYGLKEAHMSRELAYDSPYYYGFRNIDTGNNEYYLKPKEYYTYEITLDQRGFDEMVSDLDRIDYEEWLRKNNPSLQAAWEHYQTILNLVK